jgi:hypothetical protein
VRASAPAAGRAGGSLARSSGVARSARSRWSRRATKRAKLAAWCGRRPAAERSNPRTAPSGIACVRSRAGRWPVVRPPRYSSASVGASANVTSAVSPSSDRRRRRGVPRRLRVRAHRLDYCSGRVASVGAARGGPPRCASACLRTSTADHQSACRAAYAPPEQNTAGTRPHAGEARCDCWYHLRPTWPGSARPSG